MAPASPDLEYEEDTRNFDDVDLNESSLDDTLPVPKGFVGNHLPFIGFTYSNQFEK